MPGRTLAACAWAMIATAQADDLTRSTPTPEEARIVDRCASAARAVADQRLCIGVVSAPCRDTPDGGTTLGGDACLGREYRAWDGLLNRHHRAAMDAFDDEGRSYLKGTQRAWLEFRDRA